MRKCAIYLLFLLISCNGRAIAQYQNLKFESYSTLDGLSSSTCIEIFQDSKGFLWFGTIDGLNRYDGYSFEIYRPSLTEPNSISNNRINTITEDDKGNLWIGTNNGLNVFNYKTEKFHRINLYEGNVLSFKLRNVIKDILFDEKFNCIWIATGNGACQVKSGDDLYNSFENPKISYYVSSADDTNSLDNNSITAILQDKNGDIWFATEGRYINRYNRTKDNFRRVLLSNEKQFKLSHLPNLIAEDNDGDFWIGNDLSRLVFWDRSENKIETISLSGQSIPIFDIYVDKEGILWIATDGHGVFLFNKSLNTYQTIVYSDIDPYSIPNNQISKIIEDRTGTFWLATYNKGVCMLALSKSIFKHYYHQPGNETSLSTEIAQSVLEDSKGRIWVGADGGGLNLLNAQDNNFIHFFADAGNPKTLSSNKILFLEESYDHNLWVCTWDGGLNHFNTETYTSKHYKNNPSDNTSLGQNTVWCAKEDNFHGVWLGTQTSGLNFLVPEEGRFLRFTNSPNDTNSLISNFVFSLFIDSRNRLLIGTSLGLEMLDIEEFYRNNYNVPGFHRINGKSIQGERINYITEDHKGNMWVGSDLGLHKLDSNLNYVKTYTASDGLPNNLIVGIAEDDFGFIWITSKGGLSRLDPGNNKFKNFNSHDGLQGIEFQSKSIDKTRDGNIIIGGINGINILEPDKFITYNDSVVPILTHLRLFNKPVKAGDTVNGRVLLDGQLSDVNKIVLNHNEGYLSIGFVALYYQNPERVQYAYRMKNLDKDYILAGSNRTANYSNLAPGEYVFEVKASLLTEWDNAASSNINIKVLPPPWKTWWAYSLYIAFISLLVWVALKYYTSIVREEKERELDQMKLRFFINVAHEFRTPLTLILNPIDKIISSFDKPEIVRESSMIIQKSARRLLNLVNQLLDFRKMDMEKTPLELENGDIVRFCKDIVTLFEDLIKVKNITFSFDSSNENIVMSFDPDKIEKIVTNLLSNAIKFTKEGGAISLSVNIVENTNILKRRKNQESVAIIVKDTGVGIKNEHLKNVFNRFFHIDKSNTGTGIGLNFTKGLVELHQGHIQVESEYQKGTTFIVTLPRYIDKSTESGVSGSLATYQYNHTSIQSTEYEISISDNEAVNDLSDNNNLQENKNRPTVLIVEDNKELRLHLKNELNTQFRVREAIHGKQGLETVNKNYPDIVISDVMMPEMDGFELCRRIKSDIETCHIPVILLTARSLEEDRIEGYNKGADEYLPKPFNINVLKARVNNLLEIKKKLREKFSSISGIVPSSEVTTNTLDETFLDKATKIVLDNINITNFGLDNLFNEMGVSRSQFYRKISSITGQNPSNFIRTIRLKYAAELLVNSMDSIKEVAYNCGFNSTAYFSKTFRELYGMTPMQYIDQNKKTK